MSDAIARREDSDLIKKIAEEKALKEARKAQLAAKRLEKKAARSIKKIDLNGDRRLQNQEVCSHTTPRRPQNDP